MIEKIKYLIQSIKAADPPLQDIVIVDLYKQASDLLELATKKPTQRDKAFMQGYFCACASLMQMHDEETLVREMIGSEFKSVGDLRRHEVSDSDIATLMPVIKEIKRRRKEQKHE